MSTHRITDTTKIPFPCDLIKADGSVVRFINDPAEIMRLCKPDWDYVKDGGFTHYSTNRPDQRPEDVGEDCDCGLRSNVTGNVESCPRCQPTPDLARLSETAAKKVCANLGPLPELDHNDLASIIASAFEPMAREVEALRELWTEMRVVLAQSRDANCLASYGAAQVDAVEAANKVLNRMPADVASELSTLRAEVEKWKTDHTRLQMELDASCNAEELRRVRAENERLRAELEEVQKDANLQRTRLGAILWSGALDKHTAGEVREWTEKYMAELTALRAENECLKQDNNNLQAINSDLVAGNERLRQELVTASANSKRNGEAAEKFLNDLHEANARVAALEQDRERLNHVLNVIRKNGTKGLAYVYSWSAEYPLDRAAIDSARHPGEQKEGDKV